MQAITKNMGDNGIDIINKANYLKTDFLIPLNNSEKIFIERSPTNNVTHLYLLDRYLGEDRTDQGMFFHYSLGTEKILMAQVIDGNNYLFTELDAGNLITYHLYFFQMSNDQLRIKMFNLDFNPEIPNHFYTCTVDGYHLFKIVHDTFEYLGFLKTPPCYLPGDNFYFLENMKTQYVFRKHGVYLTETKDHIIMTNKHIFDIDDKNDFVEVNYIKRFIKK